MANNIIIVGAGTAGATLWRCLRAKGFAPTLLESASTTARHTYPVTLTKSALEPLARLSGTSVDTVSETCASHKLTSSAAPCVDADTRTINASRQKLERHLLQGADVHTGVTAKRFARRNNATELFGEDDRAPLASAKLVIVADGVHSFLRPLLAPRNQLAVLPFVVINGKRRLTLDQFAQTLLPQFGGASSIHTRIRDTLLCVSYWLHDDGERVNISYTYSRPVSDNDALWTPNRSKSAAGEIPDALYAELEGLELGLPFAHVFAPEKVREDRKLNWLMRKSVMDDEAASQLADAGIVAIGDAAHSAPILGSEGGVEAIRDAAEVAELVLKGEPYDILGFYQKMLPVWKTEAENSEERLREMHGQAPATSAL